jgi:hypothetical protein
MGSITDPAHSGHFFVRQWDGYDHARFLKWAYDRFKVHTYTSRHRWESAEAFEKRNTAERYLVLHKLYRVGKLHKCLDGDYPSFDRKMGYNDYYHWKQTDPRSYGYRYGYRCGKTYDDYYPRKGAHFRQRVPLSIAEKKVVTEELQSKRDWRQWKGIDRDKANHGYRYGSGCKTWAKKYSNRCFRRYEKNEMSHERYGDLFVSKRKDYFDPWMWD